MVGEAVDLAAVVVALLALLFTAVQTRLALTQARTTLRFARESRSYDYSARFNSPELLPYLDGAIKFLTATDQQAKWKEWQAMSPKEMMELTLVLNFFEELAGSYNRGELTDEIIAEYLAFAVIPYWRLASWFVYRLREADENLYRQWETMYTRLAPAPKGGSSTAETSS